MRYSIRNATSTDLETVLALNESEVPHVGSITMTDMQDFLAKAVYFRVTCDETGDVVASLIGLDPDTEYDSLNFQWFCDHYEDFAYVDRIAVAPSARRQGVAEALYEDFASIALDWTQCLCCEVNLRPANQGSMAYHQRIGFNQVGSLETHGGSKKVAFLLKKIS
jgi:predicted GNAT superfamily acetyltransferase